MIRVTIWNEFIHEKEDADAKAVYPDGIHAFVKSFLECDDIVVKLACLEDENQGITDELLEQTDVLMWWGHVAHGRVDDAIVEKIRQRVYAGMGFIPMHSAHHSKPFRAILGTTGNLTWGRNQRGVVWNLMPTHPIADGIPSHFEIEEELYSEPFYIPKPDDLLFATWFEDGNLFRGGATFTRGLGKIFYFHPGHETCRSFYNPHVQRILQNAVRYCAPGKIDSSFDGQCNHQTQPVIAGE